MNYLYAANNFFMKTVFFAGIFLLLLSCGSSADKHPRKVENSPVSSAVPLAQQSVSDQRLTKIIDDYFNLKNALTDADTSAVQAAAIKLLAAIDTARIDSVDAAPEIDDPAAKFESNIIAETKGLIGETDITEQRRSFSMISENLKSLLEIVQYKGQDLYEQTCPMAFNETETASWLSNSTEIVNPYLGKKHPKYKAGMLHCGELTDTLSFK